MQEDFLKKIQNQTSISSDSLLLKINSIIEDKNSKKEDLYEWAVNIIQYTKKYFCERIFEETRKKLEIECVTSVSEEIMRYLETVRSVVESSHKLFQMMKKKAKSKNDEEDKTNGELLFKIFVNYILNQKEEVVKNIQELEKTTLYEIKPYYMDYIQNNISMLTNEEIFGNSFNETHDYIFDSEVFFNYLLLDFNDLLNDKTDQKLYETIDFNSPELANEINQKMETNLINALGCTAVCPYCGIKCNRPLNHIDKHFTKKHRTMGFNGLCETAPNGGGKSLVIDICDSEDNVINSKWKEPQGNLVELDNQSKEFKIQLKERLKEAGATIGHLNFSLSWHDANDLDLHVTCPCGTHIYFGNKRCAECLAELDVDMNAGGVNDSNNPVEHIKSDCMKNGKYAIKVHYYSKKSNSLNSPFEVTIHTEEKQLFAATGSVSEIDREWNDQFYYSPGISFAEHLRKYYQDKWLIGVKPIYNQEESIFNMNCHDGLNRINEELKKFYQL